MKRAWRFGFPLDRPAHAGLRPGRNRLRQRGRPGGAGALHRALDAGTYPELRRLDPSGQRMLYAEHVADTHMAFEDFIGVERDKINQGEFGGRPYFLRFVLRPQDLGERYGDRCYEPAGHAVIGPPCWMPGKPSSRRAAILWETSLFSTACRPPICERSFPIEGASVSKPRRASWCERVVSWRKSSRALPAPGTGCCSATLLMTRCCRGGEAWPSVG